MSNKYDGMSLDNSIIAEQLDDLFVDALFNEDDSIIDLVGEQDLIKEEASMSVEDIEEDEELDKIIDGDYRNNNYYDTY